MKEFRVKEKLLKKSKKHVIVDWRERKGCLNIQVKGVHDLGGRTLRQMGEVLPWTKPKPRGKGREWHKDFKEMGEKPREPDVIG